MKKTDQRALGLQARASLPIPERSRLSKIISQHVLTQPWIKETKTISCYLSFRDEVETHTLIQTLLEMGKLICVPHTEKGNPEMTMVKLERFDDLEKGHYGILSPPKTGQTIISPKDIDVCLLPGATFDLWGNRIGYGAGYYDRYLAQLRPKAVTCGLAFSVQIVKQIQADDFDVPLDHLITEYGLIR